MIDLENMSDNAILALIGRKLKEIRLSQDVSQQTMAQTSGISVFTITQAENGHNTSVLNIIKGLRAIGCLHMLEPFILNESKVERKRASFRSEYSDYNEVN